MRMYKYSTPTLVFKVNVDLTTADNVELSIADHSGTTVVFSKERFVIEADNLKLKLNSDDLASLTPGTIKIPHGLIGKT